MKYIKTKTEDLSTISIKEIIKIIKETNPNKQGFLLLKLTKKQKKEVLKHLTNADIIKFLGYIDPDDITDLLQILDNHRRKKIIKKLNKSLKEKVEYLLKFNPRTAAGIMSLEYIELDRNITFKKLGEIIKKHERRTGKIPALLIIEDGFLVGELPISSLAIAEKTEKVEPYIKKVPYIKYDKTEREVLSAFKKHAHNKIVVLNEDDSIMGVIYTDDILSIIENASTNNLRNFAGVSEEEDVLDNAIIKVKNRYKWLIINLGTAFLAAFIIGLFENTIAKLTLLAIYMPIVAGMGGNSGTQTLAVMVRGLTLKEVNKKTAKNVILNEMLAGGINGIINGIIVAIIAVLWNKNPLLGAIIGISMIINLIIAGLFGSIIPIIMNKLGKDPASSATIFITTATDVFGFFIFLGLADIFLI